jgi:hypothetical protein
MNNKKDSPFYVYNSMVCDIVTQFTAITTI